MDISQAKGILHNGNSKDTVDHYGVLSLILGTLGIYLPILPTVPLYLLASFSFLNSSDALYQRFRKSSLYKKYLSRYLEAGGLTKRGKIRLILFVTAQIVIAAYLVRNSIVGLILLSVIYLGFLFSILFIVKTVPPKK